MHTHSNKSVTSTLALAISLALLSGCGDKSSQEMSKLDVAEPVAENTVIQIDGSSTVYPLAEAVAEEFQAETKGNIRITVGVSGTGGGFKKFCRGELDISNASRPIQKSEMEICAAAGIKYYELPVAYDALTVVVHPQNPLNSITIDELKRMWEPEAQGQINTWKQINSEWSDVAFALYGAGADSGTFDYFTEAVVGKAKSSRGDFTASEDDNVLVQGVSNDVNAIGYFGYAYYAQNKEKLKALNIQASSDQPAVGPSMETVIDGTYMPLARPMFIYVSDKAWARAEVKTFVGYFLTHAETLAAEVDYVPLPSNAYVAIKSHLAEGKLGTVFKGEPTTVVTIDDLLKREAGL